MKKIKDILTPITGFLMAFADSVPGVSGGTIAYILGRYEQLIESITILTSKTGDKKQAIRFLIKLMCGWIIGFIIAVLIITSIVENHIYELSSLFLGFIVFSIPFIIKEELNVIKGKYLNIIFTLIGLTVVILISKFANSNISLISGNMNIISYIYIFIAGTIAITAMLLPGISGSTLLVIFGLYLPIINAIKDVLHLDFSGLLICFIFGLGILFGLKFASKLIKNALDNHRSIVVYLIIGLMLGSIYAIIVGPTTVTNENDVNLGYAVMNFKTFSIIFFLIGITAIASLDFLKSKLEKK